MRGDKMWFLNKKTGIKWQVTEKEIQNRLLNNKDYEVVNEDKESVKIDEKSNATTKKKSPVKGA
jgi:hypothetical protein